MTSDEVAGILSSLDTKNAEIAQLKELIETYQSVNEIHLAELADARALIQQIGTNTAQALNAKLDSDEKHQAEIARLRKALTAIRTIKDRIPFDAADAATECIRIARIALEEK